MTGFKRPEDLEGKEATDSLSTRIKSSAKDVLEKAAKKQGKSLSWLAGRILEEYAIWLANQKK